MLIDYVDKLDHKLDHQRILVRLLVEHNKFDSSKFSFQIKSSSIEPSMVHHNLQRSVQVIVNYKL